MYFPMNQNPYFYNIKIFQINLKVGKKKLECDVIRYMNLFIYANIYST